MSIKLTCLGCASLNHLRYSVGVTVDTLAVVLIVGVLQVVWVLVWVRLLAKGNT